MTTTTHANDGSTDAYIGLRNRLNSAVAEGLTLRVGDRPIEGRYLTDPIHQCLNGTWSITVKARTTRGSDIVFVKVGKSVDIADDAPERA